MGSTEHSQKQTRSKLALKVPPLILLAVFAAVMALLPEVVALPRLGSWHVWWCLVIALLGVSICLAGVFAFRQARTTVDPTRPATATSLVVRGIYHHTRNPMYLGFLLALLAWALYLAKLSALAGLPLFVWYLTVFQIKPEESALRERFGGDFDAYAAAVRRWL
ncbi:protein-S-isoprenylcysteine methyltransferase [Hylemonella gracilis str. Niagara R]|uniref:Protein-S-isoprenylcysteine methyltransferase n=2 Tax=Hylemonella gracilis TaxID=80880 RepID=A0A016XEU7_9BURK|nr:protein-S-isoprenylcysteine methyltransferase [Hylemonella gracilis str. Niagara R]